MSIVRIRSGQARSKSRRKRCALAAVFYIENANEHPSGRPVDGHKEVAAAALISHLRQVFHVDVDVAGLIGFEGTVFWPGFFSLQAAQVPHTMTT